MKKIYSIHLRNELSTEENWIEEDEKKSKLETKRLAPKPLHYLCNYLLIL